MSDNTKANFGTYDKVLIQIQKWEHAIENLKTPFEKLKSTLNGQEAKSLQVCLDKITESANKFNDIQTDLNNMYNGKMADFNELKSYVTPINYDCQFCVKIDTISTYKDLLTGDFDEMPQRMENDINYRTHDISETTTKEETQKQDDEKSNYWTLMNALSDLNFAWSNIKNDYNSIESNFNRLKTYVETDNKYYWNNVGNNFTDGGQILLKTISEDLVEGILELPKLLYDIAKFVGEGVIKLCGPVIKQVFKGNKGVNDFIDNSNKDFDKSIDTLKSGFNYVISGKCLDDLKYEYQIHGWGGMIGYATGTLVATSGTAGAGGLLACVKSISQLESIISKVITGGGKLSSLGLKLTTRGSKLLNELKRSKGVLSKVKFVSKEVDLKNRLGKTGKSFNVPLYESGVKKSGIKKILKDSAKDLAEKYTPYGYVKDVKKIINFTKDLNGLPEKLHNIDKNLNKNIKSKAKLENKLNNLLKDYEIHENRSFEKGYIVKEIPKIEKSIKYKENKLHEITKEIEKLIEEESNLNDLNVNKEKTEVLRNHKIEKILLHSLKIIARYNEDREKEIEDKDNLKSVSDAQNNIEKTLKSLSDIQNNIEKNVKSLSDIQNNIEKN